MGWETRKGRRYYYEAKKISGRVVKRYVGSEGVDWVESAANLDRLSRNHRGVNQQAVHMDAAQAVREIDAMAATVTAFYREVQQIATATIEAAGYHRHDRGAWRKRQLRTARKQIPATENYDSMDDVEVMKRARDGDKSALPALDKVLTGLIERNDGSFPRGFALGERVMRELAELMTRGGDLLNRSCIVREVEVMIAEVGGPDPSPLERLLAERVAVCYVHVQFADMLYQNSLKDSVAGTVSGVLLDRQERAQAKYLAAIKALAQVRRLSLPTMQIALPGATQIGQVNVGEKQINLTGQAQGAAQTAPAG